MRISNNMIFERTLRDINQNRTNLANVQRDISTGKRLHRGSDDPRASALVQASTRELSEVGVYLENIEAGRTFLRDTDAALGNYQEILLAVQDRVVQASSGALTQDTRKQLASELSQLRESIRQVANTRDAQGRYLFNGLRTSGEPPYPAGDLTLGSQENSSILLEMGRGQKIPLNVVGNELFGVVSPPSSGPTSPPPPRTDIFDAIDGFVKFLQDGKSDALPPGSTSLTMTVPQLAVKAVKDALARSISSRGSVSSRLERLDEMTSRLSDRKQTLEARIDDLQATDITAASVKFNQYDVALRTALSLSGRTLPTSLVDFLR
ncbi:MAG: flagellar hook-associated protein FlgL [Candidatus Sericytochromatia bacterium]|nr:flagellar hook-associated protein FlgL [Candidatus Sericytochromatia bacterium]